MIFSFIRLQCNQSDFEDFLMHKFSCRHCFVCLWVNAGLQSLASCCCFHFYERWVIQCCLLKQTWQSSHWSLLFSWMKYCTIWTLHHVRECDNTGLVLLIFECENTNTTCDSLLVVEQLFWTDFIGIVSRDRCKGLINICVRFGFSPIRVLSPLLFCRTVCFSLPAFVHSFCLFFLFLFFFIQSTFIWVFILLETQPVFTDSLFVTVLASCVFYESQQPAALSTSALFLLSLCEC